MLLGPWPQPNVFHGPQVSVVYQVSFLVWVDWFGVDGASGGLALSNKAAHQEPLAQITGAVGAKPGVHGPDRIRYGTSAVRSIFKPFAIREWLALRPAGKAAPSLARQGPRILGNPPRAALQYPLGTTMVSVEGAAERELGGWVGDVCCEGSHMHTDTHMREPPTEYTEGRYLANAAHHQLNLKSLALCNTAHTSGGGVSQRNLRFCLAQGLKGETRALKQLQAASSRQPATSSKQQGARSKQ